MSAPDTGEADPRLAAALAAGDSAEVAAALVDARLIVGVVALPGEQVASEGEMALALLESASGARALPAFTSLAALHHWREDARPVPRPAVELARAVRSEGLAALVVDVAGPVPWTLEGDEIDALAAGFVPAGEQFTARRVAPVLRPPTWEPTAGLIAAADAVSASGAEVYAVDVQLDRPTGSGPRGPALGLALPPGVAPAPVAERLLAAAGQPLDLLLLDADGYRAALRVGHRVA